MDAIVNRWNPPHGWQRPPLIGERVEVTGAGSGHPMLVTDVDGDLALCEWRQGETRCEMRLRWRILQPYSGA